MAASPLNLLSENLNVKKRKRWVGERAKSTADIKALMQVYTF
jgi:hypothetical protein